MSSFFEMHNSSSDFASTFEAIKTLQNLSKPVQQHLTRVYTTLAGLAGLLALGAFLHVNQLFLFGGGLLSFLIGIFSVFTVLGLPDTPENKYLRYGLLFNFAFMEGLSIGPLIQHTLNVDYSQWDIDRERLYSHKSNIRLLHIKRLIQSKILFSAELYFGLILFCGYVLYDTQLILYRASKFGSRDVVGHSLDLFIDLVGIFVRILTILTRNAEEKEDRKRKKRS
ncbi:6493_t:CDS:2 [Ambispora gerdemannii]|uniref:6493_t:CDS:1 n=1 Tax=Ambispora gerdemannii TaxID=144530 RepID=A0A9N8YSX8_9GLOM|nr:6493_t:CDS:2 [Ambispora gerdemannii]